MRRDFLLVFIILMMTAMYFLSPLHRASISGAYNWWHLWLMQSRHNELPNERGLNVAVLDADGTLLDVRSFDTYLRTDSGFAAYINSLPANKWVFVAVKDEASASLSGDDLQALRFLGGSEALAGQRNWAYILVGRPGLTAGKGGEWLGKMSLDVSLKQGQLIGGLPLPKEIRIYSYGYQAGSFVGLGLGPVQYTKLRHWVKTALERG